VPALAAAGLRDDAELALCGAAATLGAVRLALASGADDAAVMARLHQVTFTHRGSGSEGGAALGRVRRVLRSGWPASRLDIAWRLAAALEVQRGSVAAAQRTLERAAAACPHAAAIGAALLRFELEFGGGDRARSTTLASAIEATGVGVSLAEFEVA
jgi:hypothetical protein